MLNNKRKNVTAMFCTLTALCLILFFAVTFTACDNKPEPTMHTVTFVYDNGTENNTIEVEEGKFLTKPTNPSKTGYTFDGWFIDDFKWDFELVAVMKDTTLTAKWTEIPTPTTFTVKFIVDGQQFGETQTIESGSKATCPATAPTKTGYDFAGWFLGDEKWSFTLIPVTENIELVAHWIEIPTPATYTVTFVYDNGTENNIVEVEEGKYATKPTDPIKDGYTFNGWFIDDFKWDFELVAVMEDTTLTAKWTIVEYEISYVLNGGENSELNPATYTVGDSITLADPTRTGYNFTRWSEGSSIAEGSTGNKTFTAIWEPIHYKINYVLNGGENSELNPDTYTIEDSIAIDSPTKRGYYFLGWEEGTYMIEVGSMGEKTFTAKWTIHDYFIQYILHGGAENYKNPSRYTINDSITFEDSYRYGYIFEGWFDYHDKTKRVISIEKGSVGDLDLEAKWKAIDYDIHYELNGGTNNELNPATYTIEDTITLADPTRENYIFTGWKEGKTITRGNSGEKTFTATWQIITYKITYELDGGTNHPSNPETYAIDGEVTLENPTRPFYNFWCWILDKTPVATISGDLQRDITLKALWGQFPKQEKQQQFFENLEPGDLLSLGEYEQDNNTNNGKEAIEWQVLAKEGSKVLVISKYALDFIPYNTEDEGVTWETCTLRTWLNETFYNTAFSENEKEKIVKSIVKTDPNGYTTPGNDTTDNIFLLSGIEAKKYFADNDARVCDATDYVVARDIESGSVYEDEEDKRCAWLLRTPGTYYQNCVMAVSAYGTILWDGFNAIYEWPVRPAMWIDIEMWECE